MQVWRCAGEARMRKRMRMRMMNMNSGVRSGGPSGVCVSLHPGLLRGSFLCCFLRESIRGSIRGLSPAIQSVVPRRGSFGHLSTRLSGGPSEVPSDGQSYSTHTDGLFSGPFPCSLSSLRRRSFQRSENSFRVSSGCICGSAFGCCRESIWGPSGGLCPSRERSGCPSGVVLPCSLFPLLRGSIRGSFPSSFRPPFLHCGGNPFVQEGVARMSMNRLMWKCLCLNRQRSTIRRISTGY